MFAKSFPGKLFPGKKSFPESFIVHDFLDVTDVWNDNLTFAFIQLESQKMLACRKARELLESTCLPRGAEVRLEQTSDWYCG